MIRLGNNEVLKTLTKTLTFVDASANANAKANTDAGGSTIALPKHCSGKLKIEEICHLQSQTRSPHQCIYQVCSKSIDI